MAWLHIPLGQTPARVAEPKAQSNMRRQTVLTVQGVSLGQVSVSPGLAGQWQWARGHKGVGDPSGKSALRVGVAPAGQTTEWLAGVVVLVERGLDKE